MVRSVKKSHYTISEAAKRLKVSRIAIFQAIKERRLEADWGPIAPPTMGWRISQRDLRAYEVSELHQALGLKKTFESLIAY